MENHNLILRLKNNLVLHPNTINSSISQVLLENLNEIKYLTITNVAKQANCSKSAVVKFCKTLNLTGYKQLAQILLFENEFLKLKVDKKNIEISSEQTMYLNQYYKLVQKNLESIQVSQSQNLIQAAQITRDSNCVFLFGKGPNIHLLSIFSNYLMKLNYSVFCSEDLDVQEKYAKNARENDVCYVFSYSGITPQIIQIVRQLEVQKTKIILVTANLFSSMNSEGKLVIQVLHNEEVLQEQRNSMMSFMFIVMQLVYLLSN